MKGLNRMNELISLLLIIATPIIWLLNNWLSDIKHNRKRNLVLNNGESIDIQRNKCQSYIEERLYNALVKEGYRPITQLRCGYYWIDIALPEYKLAIECDGKQWHSSPEQKKHDRKKNYYLKKKWLEGMSIIWIHYKLSSWICNKSHKKKSLILGSLLPLYLIF